MDAVQKWPTPRGCSAQAATITTEAVKKARDRFPNLETVIARRDPSVVGGSLNPPWVEWLMNWPLGWTSLDPLPPEHFERWLAPGWWHSEPPGVPRVARGVPDRVSRLKAIGNGQVAACVAMAWRLLTGRGS